MRLKASYLRVGIASLGLLGLCAGNRVEAQLTPYYIVAGDNNLVTIVQGGALVGTFNSAASNRGYPIAVRNTIWLGDVSDQGAAEYTLAGVATGNTSAGGGNFNELLDGTTDGTFNYGVEFGSFDNSNSVTWGNLDWSGQTTLFTIPFDAEGIAYDTVTGNFFIGEIRAGILREYTPGGVLVNTFTPGVSLASLAYEQATDTLWSATNSGNTIFQLSKTGAVLQTLTIANANFGNNWGGEMQIIGAQQPSAAPEPTTIALMGASVFVPGFAFLRRRLRRK